MNQVTISGFLGNDVESRQAGEHTVYSFSVGVTEKRGTESSTSWFRCEAWNKQGEVIAKFFAKGSGIVLSGKHVQEHYEKDGQKQSAWKLKVSDFSFPPVRKGEEEKPQATAQAKPKDIHAIDSDDPDLPF